MKEYLLWREIQDRLTDHLETTGTPYSFYDAVRELVEEGRARRGDSLPVLDPEEWETAGTAAFEGPFGRMAIGLDLFRREFAAERSAVESSEHVVGADAFPARIAWDQAMGLHTHDAFEMDYLLYGRGQIHLEGGTVPLRAGSLCIVGSRLTHDVTVERGGQMVSIIMSEFTVEQTLYNVLQKERVLSDFFRRGLEREPGYLLFELPLGRWNRTLLGMMFTANNARGGYEKAVCADLAELLFLELLRYQSSRAERPPAAGERSEVPIVAVLKYLQENFKTVTLAGTAERFHYNPSYLSRLIREDTGRSFTEIVQGIRLDRAKGLLRETELPVGQVAAESGYESLVYFGRAFRRETGQTPSDYRRARRDGKRE